MNFIYPVDGGQEYQRNSFENSLEEDVDTTLSEHEYETPPENMGWK